MEPERREDLTAIPLQFPGAEGAAHQAGTQPPPLFPDYPSGVEMRPEASKRCVTLSERPTAGLGYVQDGRDLRVEVEPSAVNLLPLSPTPFEAGPELPPRTPPVSRQRSSFRRLHRKTVERELNIHHAATFVSFARDIPATTQAQLQLASTGLVLAQIVVGLAILNACSAPLCSDNWQCHAKRVCAPNEEWYRGVGMSCLSCNNPLVWSRLADYFPLANTTNFSCPAHDNLCRGCYDPIARSFPTRSGTDPAILHNYAAMQWMDWSAVLLTSFVVALHMADEVRQVMFCELFRKQLVKEARQGARRGGLTLLQTLWLWIDRIKGSLLRFAMLPQLCAAAPNLIVYRGGDALQVCLNTLGLLFLIELDDWMYTHLVDGDTRAKVEEKARKELGEAEEACLSWTTSTHKWAVSVAIVVGTLLEFRSFYYFAVFTALFTFLAAAIAESQQEMRVKESQKELRVTEEGGHFLGEEIVRTEGGRGLARVRACGRAVAKWLVGTLFFCAFVVSVHGFKAWI